MPLSHKKILPKRIHIYIKSLACLHVCLIFWVRGYSTKFPRRNSCRGLKYRLHIQIGLNSIKIMARLNYFPKIHLYFNFILNNEYVILIYFSSKFKLQMLSFSLSDRLAEQMIHWAQLNNRHKKMLNSPRYFVIR